MAPLMLRWLWSKRHPKTTMNRADRRALAHLSRPQRATLQRLTNELRRLPLRQRLATLDRLAPWEREYFEDQL